MSLLAVDPGTDESGWVIWHDDNTLGAFGISPNAEVTELCRTWPGDLAIEWIRSYGQSVGREVFETCRWVGRMQQAYDAPDEVLLVFRADVKKHICKTGQATDSNVMHAIMDLFPHTGGGANPAKGTKDRPGPLYGMNKHCWAALGVALTVRVIEPGDLLT